MTDWRDEAARWCEMQYRFTTRAGAETYARWFNIGTQYTRPIIRARCRWCDGYHVVPVTTGKQARWVEKQRRKWRAQICGEQDRT